MIERLQKTLARAGVASRRAAERLIAEGRVTVNGRPAREPGTKVDPAADAIKVDGKRIAAAPAHATWILLHKPRGVVTTMSDPQGRPTVRDLLRPAGVRVFPVGRLDYDSEGLLLLTDDGDLARDLMHPSSGVEKTYRVKVKGMPDPAAIRRVARGMILDGRPTGPARVRVVKRGDNPWLTVTIAEGRRRQVRRMLEAAGHPVLRLKRVAYGGVVLGDLAPGRTRRLRPEEVAGLERAVGRSTPARPRRPRSA